MNTVKGYHCNHCRNKHRHASVPRSQGGRNCSRHNSCSKIYTGDEHWTKVLQAGEGQGQRHSSFCDHCYHRHVTRTVRIRSLSSTVVSTIRNQTNKRTKSVFRSLYSRISDWFGSSCQGLRSSFLSRFTSCNHTLSNVDNETEKEAASEGLLENSNSNNASTSLSKRNKTDARKLCYYTSQSSEDSEVGSVFTSCSSSSTLTVASVSTSSSFEGCIPFRTKRPLPVCSEPASTKQPTCREDQRKTKTKTQTLGELDEAYSMFAFKVNSCHLKTESLKLSEKSVKPFLFYSTWPLSNAKQEETRRKNCVLSTMSSLHPAQDPCNGNVTEEGFNESSVEWLIPYNDLTFDQTIRNGARHQIFRGRWHGDVLIHTYCDLEHDGVIEFLKQVSELSRIRHENICLFMGACIHAPNFAVITSDLKGPSLYEKIHLVPDKMSMRSRVNIARQVSVAMGYLHAKGVLTRKLNSRNIHLEPKVKLSLLDQGVPDIIHERINCVCLPRGSLCYMAPEILSTSIVMNSRLHCTHSYTQETDVFAFGTLLYELFAEQFPFSGNLVETVIWRLCKGRQPNLTHLNCNSALKAIIEHCWTFQSSERPSFSEINQELQQKTGLHKCHSSSQPERLNQNAFHSAGRLPPQHYRVTRQK